MIRFCMALVLSLVTSPLWAEVKIQEVTSPGGLKAWLVEDHGIPFTALEVRFRGGTSLDAPGKRGAVMLMASTLEEGAADLDSQGFAAARESLAAKIGFDADADTVSVSAQFLTENRDQGVELLRTALVSPTFDQVALDRVKGQIQSILQSNAADPSTIASDAFSHQVYGDHPYGSPDMGTPETVAALTRDDVLAAKAATMARDRVFISAVGDITPADLGKMIDRLLGDLPKKGAPLPPHAQARFDGGTRVVDFDTPQSVVIFGQPGLRFDDPDYFPLFVLNQIVGGAGFSARLMDEVRDKRGLTYGVSSNLANADLSETWVGSMASGNDKVAEAVALVRNIWAEVAAKGVTQAELDAAKTYLTGSYPLRFDGNGKIAALLVGMQLAGLDKDYPARRNSLVQAVTLEDVNRVAREQMAPEKLTFVVVGKPQGLPTSP